MSENAIDSENISKPAPDTAKPNGARKPAKKGTLAKKAARAKKAAGQIQGGWHQQEGRGQGATLPKSSKPDRWQSHSVELHVLTETAACGSRLKKRRAQRRAGLRNKNQPRALAREPSVLLQG